MEIRVLGPLEVIGDDGAVRLGASMQRRLLAALVAGAGQTRSADDLIDALWGEAPPASARKLLQVYVSQLRKTLTASACIRTRGGGYALELDQESLDVARFERLLREGRDVLSDGNPALAVALLGRALDLWRGAAYADFAYEDFARAEAGRLEDLRQIAIEERIEGRLALGRHEELLPEVLSLAAAHPLRERVQAQAMLALYRCGRQSEALDLYTAVRGRLRAELGLDPGVELRDLQRRILQHDLALVVPRRDDDQLAPLPTPPNALLGRERELDELRALLLGDVRLLVLTGAGGSGKTRLALEASREIASSFANGAAFVSLEALRDPDLVVGEISRVLGVEARPGEASPDTLAEALRLRELLLVVDNAEHLRAATPLFVELVAKAPRLTILVTSRVVLHLSGEHVYPVEPLGDAVAAALFIERANDATAHFRPTVEEEETVRRICKRLDGLPLAIELAASRIRTLTPAELLTRLDPRLPLLTGGPRDLPARQQTLRATLEWTFDLLDEDEARELMNLAVFAGGCTLEAAEAVCGTSVERLASLVDDNLLRRTSAVNGSRYAMLETIREYALERLQTAGDYETACRAHAEYYLALAEHDVGEIDHAERAALDRLERELDNFRASFAWALKNDSESALRLAAALRSHWFTGRQLEGREWLTAVLAKSHPPSHDLAALAGELARLHFFLGELEAAARWVEQALELAESLELPDVLSDALNTKHLLLAKAGRYDEALALLEQALAIAREHELDKPLLRALYNLSFQMTANDRQAEAKQNDLEGLELARQRNDWWFELVFRFNLIWGHLLLGNWDAALRVVEEGQSRPLPSPHVLLGPLPWLHVQRGEIGEARRTLDAFEPSATGLQGGSVHSLGKAVVLRGEGLFEDALLSAEEVLARRGALAGRHGYVKLALIEAVEAAFALDDLDRVSELLGEWPPHSSDRTPFVDACCEQFGARLAARSGAPDAVEPALRRATAIFRELERPFYVAVALLEHGEWLVHQGRGNDAQALLTGAEDTFQKLKARPWLDRCRSASQIGTSRL